MKYRGDEWTLALILFLALSCVCVATRTRAENMVEVTGKVSEVTLFTGYGQGMWVVPTGTWVHFSDNRSIVIAGKYLDWLEIGKTYTFMFRRSGGVTDTLIFEDAIETIMVTVTTTQTHTTTY